MWLIGWLWLVCWGSKTDPKFFGTKAWLLSLLLFVCMCERERERVVKVLLHHSHHSLIPICKFLKVWSMCVCCPGSSSPSFCYTHLLISKNINHMCLCVVFKFFIIIILLLYPLCQFLKDEPHVIVWVCMCINWS